MRASLVDTSLRVLTWGCVILLAVLSLLPDQQMVRTGLPGRLEHFVAYAGSAAIAVAGYSATRGGVQIIGGFWVYAAILEYLQHFSPGRHPSTAFRGVGAWSAVRRSCYRPPLAAPVRLAALRVIPSGGRLRVTALSITIVLACAIRA
jgi:hypothetical protein